MKTNRSINAIVLTAVLAVLLSLPSCSSPLPVEGKWTVSTEEEQTGMTLSGTRTYTFTPTGRKNGTVVFSIKGKGIIDGFGEMSFNFSSPGAYTLEKDRILIDNDTTAFAVNTAFHPTSFIGLLSSEHIEEARIELEKSLTPEPTDTLFNVVIKDGKMSLTNKGEKLEFSKSE